MNYTKPNIEAYDDKPEDWLASALIFSNALGILLKENEGLVIELKNDMRQLIPNVNKVVIYNKDGQIHITEASPELKEGQMVWLDN